MTWTEILTVWLGYALLIVALIAVVYVFVFLAWIGRHLEGCHREPRTFVTGSFESGPLYTVKPFDQEKD